MMNRKSISVFNRLLLFTAMAAIFFLATTPLQIPLVESINDKVNHAVAFFVLALLMDHSFPAGDLRYKMLALTTYGLVIEITQSYLPYRFCSLFDLGADAAGLALYGLSIPWIAKVPILRKYQ